MAVFVAVVHKAVILVPEQSCRDESRFQVQADTSYSNMFYVNDIKVWWVNIRLFQS